MKTSMQIENNYQQLSQQINQITERLIALEFVRDKKEETELVKELIQNSQKFFSEQKLLFVDSEVRKSFCQDCFYNPPDT